MWFLQNTANASLRFSLPAGKDLIIGRKNCDLQIEGDQSISRKHAILHVTGSERGSEVTLTDQASKFGTFVDGRRLSANQKVELSANSELKFGQGPTTGSFKLVYEPLVFCCSSMAGPEKQKVKQLAKTLRGRVVNSWSSECTHLVMTNLNVTIKVVSALASCRPIVTPSWLEAASQCFSEGKALPSVADYQPEVVDTNLDEGEVSFRPDFRRRTLFQDRTLHFLCDKQLATLHQCVESAGARCVDCSQAGSLDLDTLTAKESVVLSLDQDTLGQLPQEHRKWVEQVNNFLESRDLRTVNDSEIGFALLYISIEKHCNPRTREGVPEVPIALPAPTLSQMPLTQFSQDPTPPTPPSQASPHSPHRSTPSVTSILAPDSQVSSQNSAQSMPKHLARAVSEESGNSSSTSDVVMKISETVMHGAKSSHHDVSEASNGQRGTLARRKRGPASSNSSGGPKLKQPKLLDCLFEDELSPIELTGKSKGGDSHHGPVTSTQAAPSTAGKNREAGNSKTKDDLPSSIVDDSQPDLQEVDKGALNTSKLPGLKATMSHDRVSLSVIETKGDSQSSGQQRSKVSGSQDASVLVPSSLTPSSQKRKGSGDGDGGSQLPNSGLLSDLFQSKRKKRRANILDDDDDVVCIDDQMKEKEREGGRERPAAKKKRIEPVLSIGATAGSEKAVSSKGRNDNGGLQNRRKTKVEKSDQAKVSNGGDAKNSSNVTIGVSNGDSNDKKEQNTKVHKSDSGSMLTSSPTRKTSESEMMTSVLSTDRSEDKLSYRDRFSRPLDPVEQTPLVTSASSGRRGTADTEQKKTPKKSPISTSTSSFLSTRKQRRKSTFLEDDNRPGEAKGAKRGEAAPNLAVKSLFLDTQSTQYTATASATPGTCTQTAASVGARQKRLLTTPFTYLTTETLKKAPETVAVVAGEAASVGGHSKIETPFTIGRRAKVTTAADALWEEEESEAVREGRGFDGENPLGTQVDEEVSSQNGVFRPVLAEDGFIVARREPTRRVSRLGRFALRTKRELFNSSTDVGGEVGVANSSQPEVQVEIVKTKLVFRSLSEKRRESESNYENGTTSNGLKNFKKFRKTLNTNNSAAIPRFINLTVYCPKDDVTLPDWDVSEAGGEEPAAALHSEDEEERDQNEDDVFNFARPVISKRRRR